MNTTPEPTRTRRDELRVQFALLLPQLALTVTPATEPAGVPSDQHPDLDLYDTVNTDPDYNPTALAAWILDEVDGIVDDALRAALVDVQSIEESQAAVVELATASSTFASVAEWLRYLTQLEAVVRRGLTLSQSYDLSRTMREEIARVHALPAGLAERFPQLGRLLGDDVGTRAQGLVTPAGEPIV